jgi:hypothetical protein
VKTPEQSTVKTETEVQQEQKPAEATVAQNETPNELPRTAGELPLIAMIGIACLGAGLGMRVLSRQEDR